MHRTREVPTSWRPAAVIVLLKPGKPLKDAANYRPISLLSTTSEFMEWVLLLHPSDIEDILPAEQAGFHPKRNCCDQVASLTSHIEVGFQCKLKTGIALVDLSSAYDTVWRQGLLFKVSCVIHCQQTICLLATMTGDRRFKVHLNGQISRPRTLNLNIPQSSVLAPILFNLYITDIPAMESRKFMYADDIALTVHCSDYLGKGVYKPKCFWSDSPGVIHVTDQQSSRSLSVMMFARALVLQHSINNFWFTGKLGSGINNALPRFALHSGAPLAGSVRAFALPGARGRACSIPAKQGGSRLPSLFCLGHWRHLFCFVTSAHLSTFPQQKRTWPPRSPLPSVSLSDRDKHLQDLYQAFLKLQYPPAEVKKQIDRARRVLRSHLLQDRPNKENNRTPLAVTFSPQLKPLQRIIRDLQPILKDDPLLSQILGDRPVLAYRQPPNLKQILTSNHTSLNKNTDPGTYPCNKARCQLCPHIYSSDIIIGPNHISHTIRGSFTCTSINVIYAIMCQQCPSAMYIGQTGQSLRKRINGHKSDIRNHNTQKPVGEHFNLSGHSMTDLRVAILQQKNFKNRLQRETAELELICKLDTINSGLNKDWEWLSHYKH
ncbi:uncharacterized protein LOC135984072 [Chrysemys picta bellii]|uniref:uncharacterized protein LOC135984072 n=1 Tax=Chrysemys picta bellii TaxID=8478 RepID=UPI0032B2FDA8